MGRATTIVGVDYSGAATRNATGYTRGTLLGRNLTIETCERLGGTRQNAHRRLEERLLNLVPEAREAAVAMDFPFSVPRAFADALTDAEGEERATTMCDLWVIVTRERFGFERFLELRNDFVAQRGEILRRGDAAFAGPFSPLHAVRPNMLQMTFYGMRMLHHLRQVGFRVPPLPDGECTGPVLLETMPGVLLRAFNLQAQGYKNRNATNLRRHILNGLMARQDVALQIDRQFQAECINDDNCLDSLVAAVGAAMWVQNRAHFLHPRAYVPPDEEINAARLEGWIYAPTI